MVNPAVCAACVPTKDSGAQAVKLGQFDAGLPLIKSKPLIELVEQKPDDPGRGALCAVLIHRWTRGKKR